MTSIEAEHYHVLLHLFHFGYSPPPTTTTTTCVHEPTEDSDVKAAVAVLCFIFSSAAKYDVGEDSLSNELQQLGLPNGQSSVCSVFACAHVWMHVGMHTYICLYIHYMQVSGFILAIQCTIIYM